MYPIQQSTTAQPLVFLMVLTSDHITGATGLSPTVTLSKSGAAFGSPSGAVSEIANGWYKVAGNATDTNTLGPLILHATAGTADPVDIVYPIVAFNPQDSVRLGLTALPNAAAAASGGVPTVDANNAVKVQSGSGANQIDLSSGQVKVQQGTSAGQLDTTTGQVKVQQGTGAGQLDTTTGQVKVQVGTSAGQLDASSGQVKVQVGTAAGQLDTSTGQVKVQSGTAAGQILSAAGQVTVGTNNDKTGYALSAAGVDSILDDAITEPANVFAWAAATPRAILAWLGVLATNKTLQTAALQTVRNRADGATISTTPVSDDGTTFTRGSYT